MSESKKIAPAPACTGVGAGPKAYDDTNSIAGTGQECKPVPGYYAVIPAKILHDKRLTPTARLLYGTISALTQAEGYCWASNSYLAEMYDLSADRVGRLIADLEKLGYIARETVRDPATNEVKARKIWLILDTGCPVTPPVKNNDTSRYNHRDPPGENNVGNNIIDNNNIYTPYSPPEGDAQEQNKKRRKRDEGLSDAFLSFWAMYPARMGQKNGRKAAWNAWVKIKLDENSDLRRSVLDGLQRYLNSSDVKRGFAKDAATWLNGRCWEDEILTALNPDTPPDDDLLPGESPEDYIW